MGGGLGGAGASKFAACCGDNEVLRLELCIGIASEAVLGRNQGGNHRIRVCFAWRGPQAAP